MAADTPRGVTTASDLMQTPTDSHPERLPEAQNPLVIRHVVQLQDHRRARRPRHVMEGEEDSQDVVRLFPCGMRRH